MGKNTRRVFIKKTALAAMSGFLGMEIVHGANMLEQYVPIALQDKDPFKLFEKNAEMVVLNDRPWNMEAQAHLLNDNITPATNMFIRNNGVIPKDIDVNSWELTIEGEYRGLSRTVL